MIAILASSRGVGGEDIRLRYRERKDGTVELLHHGRLASTLRGAEARAFLVRALVGDPSEAQHLMARLTGNYKRGSERRAAAHPRNRGRV
jgi:hypothetical protein